MSRQLTKKFHFDDSGNIQFDLDDVDEFKKFKKVDIVTVSCLNESNCQLFYQIIATLVLRSFFIAIKVDLEPIVTCLVKVNWLGIRNTEYTIKEIKVVLEAVRNDKLTHLYLTHAEAKQKDLKQELRFILDKFDKLEELFFWVPTDFETYKAVFTRTYPNLRKLTILVTGAERTNQPLLCSDQFPNVNYLDIGFNGTFHIHPQVFDPSQRWSNLKYLRSTYSNHFEPKNFLNLRTLDLTNIFRTTIDLWDVLIQLPNLIKLYHYYYDYLTDKMFEKLCKTKLKLRYLAMKLSGHFMEPFFFKFFTTCLPDLVLIQLNYTEDESFIGCKVERGSVKLEKLLKCRALKGSSLLFNFVKEVSDCECLEIEDSMSFDPTLGRVYRCK